MKEIIKKFVFSNYYIYSFYNYLDRIKRKINKVTIINKSKLVKIKRDIIGKNNVIEIGTNSIINNLKIRIHGNGSKVIIGNNVYVGEKCSFWVEGDNCILTIGDFSTFVQQVHLNVQEDKRKIMIGNDCMFSNSIIVRTSDSHSIYDSNNNRLNPARDVNIGNHVWIAPNSKIMKGARIGNNVIIGSDTIVTKEIPDNVLAVGHPAKVVKENINWSREKIIK